MMKAVTIYGMADPVTGELRYVGKTTATIHQRLLQHMSDVRRGRIYIPRHRWIKSLLDLKLEPEIFAIEQEPQDWREAEIFWIAYFRSLGATLLNATAGGDGISTYQHTAEARARQSASAVMRYSSEEERKKTGASVSRAYEDPAVRRKLSREVSQETRSKLSAKARVHRATPEAKLALSIIRTGVLVSYKTREAIAKSWTPERRVAQAERMRQIRDGGDAISTRAKK